MTGEHKAILIITIITLVIIVAGVTLSGKKTATSPSITIDPMALVSSTTPTMHAETARISIVGFEDFACPACAMLHPYLKETLASYNGAVSFSLRLLPIHAGESIKSAVAAYAAGTQGKFFEMADLLFTNQQAWFGKNDAESKVLFIGYANSLGLDIPAFTALINSPDYIKSIETIVMQDKIDATKMGIRSTPTLVINGKQVVVGVQKTDALKRLIDAELATLETSSTTPTASATPTPQSAINPQSATPASPSTAR